MAHRRALALTAVRTEFDEIVGDIGQAVPIAKKRIFVQVSSGGGATSIRQLYNVRRHTEGISRALAVRSCEANGRRGCFTNILRSTIFSDFSSYVRQDWQRRAAILAG